MCGFTKPADKKQCLHLTSPHLAMDNIARVLTNKDLKI